MDERAVNELLDAQHGVVSRRQLRALHVTDAEIERKLRRREWARIHPGVYVHHTGPPTRAQCEWAAVLFYWPAALAGVSALHAHKVRGYTPAPNEPVEVCVGRDRHVKRRPGIVVRQHARFATLCNMDLSPPRERLEHAAIGVASRKRRLDASVGVLADLVQARRTTPRRLLAALAMRTRLRHRALLISILIDVQSGANSVLEHRYLVDVERAHGLPMGARQRRVTAAGTVTYRDVEYRSQRLTVELDGRLAHASVEDEWCDLERDVLTLKGGGLTLRARWIHVLDPCRLAYAVASALRALGWDGWITPCSADCRAFSAPGAENAQQTA
ncbi:MAG TPA: type IV toxin-antitoxin system AbiEi family antitoxin domain-containing protein [Nocardioides sp.]|uniref:type IV toxin-antitoxin system AbiEi family antitoxin domain-containing protein n=1 Tax=uncultured Nocardioides sp. TaxID=198441 RepID=UPI0026160DB3|nr:type IV toxin-antitoxin system AbiEi family antitoxin domain-containing protein [uncultured Nocardioides sp.]HRD60915.1 type IV toxin-antitoxin system AbiEi family antitoxin domain-containing protein [Nocardioides sp.]HRI94598.1 type IV toxin-antitoxin system AbiEi family antitoxin domain-containing protein [Nocardioides sp.]HRK45767.1 type IV toxin-antitoxin system AbiEi family antitoxin domain-containing protein [Nocardioides sp.]